MSASAPRPITVSLQEAQYGTLRAGWFAHRGDHALAALAGGGRGAGGALVLPAAELAVVAGVRRAAGLQARLGDALLVRAEIAAMAVGIAAAVGPALVRGEVAVPPRARRGAVGALDVAHAFGRRQ